MKLMIILKAYTYICATLFTMFAYFNYDYSNLIYYHYNYLLQDVHFCICSNNFNFNFNNINAYAVTPQIKY